jgi:hypothetical protein
MVTFAEFIAGGVAFATIFGAIVAVAAWLNGRRTTRVLREVIVEESKKTRDVLGTKMDSLGDKMDNMGKELGAKIDNMGKELGIKIDDLGKELSSLLRDILNELRARNTKG